MSPRTLRGSRQFQPVTRTRPPRAPAATFETRCDLYTDSFSGPQLDWTQLTDTDSSPIVFGGTASIPVGVDVGGGETDYYGAARCESVLCDADQTGMYAQAVLANLAYDDPSLIVRHWIVAEMTAGTTTHPATDGYVWGIGYNLGLKWQMSSIQGDVAIINSAWSPADGQVFRLEVERSAGTAVQLRGYIDDDLKHSENLIFAPDQLPATGQGGLSIYHYDLGGDTSTAAWDNYEIGVL